MVGVPRSQGCRHCRRKKKGCDLQRPTCGQCARLGLDCSYEGKKWTFVRQAPVADIEDDASKSTVAVRSRSTPNLKRIRSESPPISLPEQSLGKTDIELVLTARFWDVFLPSSCDRSIQGIHAGPWSRVVRDLAYLDPAVNVCLSACACTAIGRIEGDMSLLQEGTRLYAKALRLTNLALQDPIRAQWDSTLACVKLLSTYESWRLDHSPSVSTQANDWHTHVDGTNRIVQLRGPAKHVSNHGHALFEEARILAVISGIVQRKPSFFTEMAWYTIPWENQPRNIRDGLLDIMVALPDVLYRQDMLSQSLKELSVHEDLFAALTAAQAHINRCIMLANALQEWETTTLKTVLELASEPAPESRLGPLTLLEVCKDFGYGFFHTVNFYWTACIVLYGSVWVLKRNVELATMAFTTALQQQQAQPTKLETSSSSSNPPPSPIPILLQLPRIPSFINPQPFATNISRNAAYYFEPNAGMWGPTIATISMGAALHYYAVTGAHDSAEMGALLALFRRPKFGKPAGEFLRSMAQSGSGVKGDSRDRGQHTAMARSWYGTDVLQGTGKEDVSEEEGE